MQLLIKESFLEGIYLLELRRRDAAFLGCLQSGNLYLQLSAGNTLLGLKTLPQTLTVCSHVLI